MSLMAKVMREMRNLVTRIMGDNYWVALLLAEGDRDRLVEVAHCGSTFEVLSVLVFLNSFVGWA